MAALAVTLAACAPEPGPSPEDGPFPPGVDPRGAGDTGIEVGHRLMGAGEYELALRAYYRTAADDGMNPELLASIGSANLRLDRLDQAEAQLREAIARDEDLVLAWNNLGVILVERGEIGEASRVFRTAFALDAGNSPEIRENLRLVLANLDASEYTERTENNDFQLVQQNPGQYLLLSPS